MIFGAPSGKVGRSVQGCAPEEEVVVVALLLVVLLLLQTLHRRFRWCRLRES